MLQLITTPAYGKTQPTHKGIIMSKMINNFAGMNGFIWWMGVVENRIADPLKLGRCQVRIFGWHTENTKLIPSEDLPWCLPVLPSNNSANFATPLEGDYVVGFFADSESGQFPIMFGVLPGIKTSNPSGDSGFQDPRTTAQIATAPQPPPSDTATTATTQTTNPNQTAIDQPTTSPTARGVFVGTALEKAYNNRAHVCDITAETAWAIAKVKSAIMKYVKIIREAIAALFAGTASLPIVQQIKQAINYLKQKIKLLKKELQPILDEIKALQKYMKTIQDIIKYLASLPAQLGELLRACLGSLGASLKLVSTAVAPLVAAAAVINNAQTIAQTSINKASSALTVATVAAAAKLKPKLA